MTFNKTEKDRIFIQNDMTQTQVAAAILCEFSPRELEAECVFHGGSGTDRDPYVFFVQLKNQPNYITRQYRNNLFIAVPRNSNNIAYVYTTPPRVDFFIPW